MTEEATTTETTETKDKTLVETPVSPVKPDGTFIENWYQHELLPEGVRGEKSLEVIKTFPDLVKRTVNAEKLVGRNKIALPTDKSKPEEWDALYLALGRPKTAEEYQVEVPDDLKDIFTSERLARSFQRAHKIGATQKQVAEYMAGEIEEARQMLAEQEKFEAEEKVRIKKEAEDNLRQEFGMAYDERVHVANRLIAEAFDNEEEKMAFTEKYGNDPVIVRLMSKIGARMTEHKALIAELTTNTPAEAQAKIKQLEATPGYMQVNSDMPKEQRESITAQIRELYKQVYPAKAGR